MRRAACAALSRRTCGSAAGAGAGNWCCRLDPGNAAASPGSPAVHWGAPHAHPPPADPSSHRPRATTAGGAQARRVCVAGRAVRLQVPHPHSRVFVQRRYAHVGSQRSHALQRCVAAPCRAVRCSGLRAGWAMPPPVLPAPGRPQVQAGLRVHGVQVQLPLPGTSCAEAGACTWPPCVAAAWPRPPAAGAAAAADDVPAPLPRPPCRSFLSRRSRTGCT